MDELRWVLLGLGVLFIGGLAWWELRKPRHSGQRAADEGFIDAEPQAARRVEPRFGDTSDLTVPQGDLPSMRALHRGDHPPLVMVDSMSEGERTVNISIASDVAVDAPGAAPEAPTDVQVSWTDDGKIRVTLEGEALSRPPRGYDAEHPLIEDLKRKDFISVARFSEKEACSAGFIDQFSESCRAASPFMKFLTEALELKF